MNEGQGARDKGQGTGDKKNPCPTSRVPYPVRGLTFVEMLLATVLFTVVLGAASSLLFLGMRSQRLSPRAEAVAFEHAMLQLEHDLDAAQLLAAAPALMELDRIEFAAVARLDDGGGGRTGWCRIRYSVAADGEARTLIREQLDLDDRVIAQEALLPVAEAAFSYAVSDGQQLAWQAAEWPAEVEGVPQMPRLIRLTGRLAGPEAVAIERVLRLPDGVIPTVSP